MSSPSCNHDKCIRIASEEHKELELAKSKAEKDIENLLADTNHPIIGKGKVDYEDFTTLINAIYTLHCKKENKNYCQ